MKKNIKGIVLSPQFNTEYYDIGDAVFIKCPSGFATKGIITSSQPLEIVVQYYNRRQSSFNKVNVDINSVVNELYEISKLTIEDGKTSGSNFEFLK